MLENFAVENLVDMKGGVMSKETLGWAEFGGEGQCVGAVLP